MEPLPTAWPRVRDFSDASAERHAFSVRTRRPATRARSRSPLLRDSHPAAARSPPTPGGSPSLPPTGAGRCCSIAPLTALLISLHSSLQHEIVHGHPTRWHRLNRLLGMVPLSLWLPYDRYRTLHRQHHVDARLTDPLDDPESFYWLPEQWAAAEPGHARASCASSRPWPGGCSSARSGASGHSCTPRRARSCATSRACAAPGSQHLLWCVPVIAWVKLVCGMPLWIYFLAMVVPANGIQLIRSFAEHRARPQAAASASRSSRTPGSSARCSCSTTCTRCTTRHPLIPWYEYPARYRMIRERLIADQRRPGVPDLLRRGTPLPVPRRTTS